MPRKSQPVPPIYQPEVAAEAVYFAAHRRRRELCVGISTVVVITMNKLLARVGDWYLARTGFASQQYDGAPASRDRHNLWRALDQEVDFGSHGEFDSRSHSGSLQLWSSIHRGPLAASLVAAAAALSTMALFFRKSWRRLWHGPGRRV